MSSVGRYVKTNALAVVALFVALGGSSYAAFSLPHNSVGTRQIRNGAVTPRKLDSRLIGGTVRAWAFVSAAGHPYIEHGFGRVFVQSEFPGTYGLALKVRNDRGCSALSTVSFDGEQTAKGPGYAVVSPPLGPPRLRSGPSGVRVATFDTGGVPTALPFVVELLC